MTLELINPDELPTPEHCVNEVPALSVVVAFGVVAVCASNDVDDVLGGRAEVGVARAGARAGRRASRPEPAGAVSSCEPGVG
jgi:hypothetical protein